jgi:fructosamine-3-kinase
VPVPDPGLPWPVGGAAARLERLTGSTVTELRPIGGGHGVRHYRARLADGRDLFVKAAADPSGAAGPPGRPAADSLSLAGPGAGAGAAFAAQASGLRWLSEAKAVPVPELICADNGLLAVIWLPHASADRAAAERFGGDLARLHAAGSASFGAPWPGFIASLPLPNDQAESWPPWYAQQRLLPFARLARQAGTLSRADVALIEKVADRITELAGPAEPPSRIHGDCWSGNVLWSSGRGALIDPAAHGGHRESDLAMLALFGAPYLDRILAAYQEQAPLADGWRQRAPLHQLHPLLAHVCLFGAGYRDAALAAARAALAG